MDEVSAWIEEFEEDDLGLTINRMSSKLYAWLEAKRTRQEKVSIAVLNVVKSVTDYMTLRSLDILKKNIILETKLSERAHYDKLLEGLAEKISNAPIGVENEVMQTETLKTRRSDHALIVETKNDGDIEEVRKTVREFYRGNKDIPEPGDVIVTKNKQLILKMKSRRETERARDALEKVEKLKESARINIPNRRRKRMMILSVDKDVTEEQVKRGLERVLAASNNKGELHGELSGRLNDLAVDEGTRKILQDVYRDSLMDFDIIRQVKTRIGKINWLIDVDDESRQNLLDTRRICIDFERYRVVDFISIARCYNCQEFGHYAGSCKNDTRCAKCSGPHNQRECKSKEVKCCNCYSEDTEEDCGHQADSQTCPSYLEYRKSRIPDRS